MWRLLARGRLHVGRQSTIVVKPFFDRPRPFEVILDITADRRAARQRVVSIGHAAMAVAGALAGSRDAPVAAGSWWPLRRDRRRLPRLSRRPLADRRAGGALLGLASPGLSLGGRQTAAFRP